MIALNESQKEALHCVTHDLMLTSAFIAPKYQDAVTAALAALYAKVLLASEDEAIECATRAEVEMNQRLDTLFAPEGAPN